MSNGDDENADAPEDVDDGEASADAEATAPENGGEVEPAVTAETLDSRLDDVEAELDAAETEADLDAVEAELDAIEADLEAADLQGPDEEASDEDDGDEDEADPAEEIRSRIDDLREDLEAQRGPYAEDVQSSVTDSAGTIRDTRWTENGEPDVRAASEDFLATASDELDATFGPTDDDLEAHAAALEEAGATIAEAGLDADEDAATIETLLEAADELTEALEAAEEWSDLTVVQQLEKQGFYDRLEPANHKDFPPERNVVRIAERENDPERIVMALEHFESDFMEEVALDALERMGAPEAFDLVHERAKKRGRHEIRVLGKIGDERAVETLLEFVNGDNPPLQKVTIRALGEIGSEDATQAVADALEDDEPTVRYQAARTLGLLGDTRAIDPLGDRLENADDDQFRAACAWALVQIGTEDALSTAAEYDDDRAYTVQAEAEKARDATTA